MDKKIEDILEELYYVLHVPKNKDIVKHAMDVYDGYWKYNDLCK